MKFSFRKKIRKYITVVNNLKIEILEIKARMGETEN